MFQVTLQHNGAAYYLRRTIWTAYIDRADSFATESEGRAALDRAKPFMKAAQFKAARIVPAQA